MAFPPRLRPNSSILSTLRYSDKFDYPLTIHELWYWQIRTRLSLSQITNEVKRLGKLGQLEIIYVFLDVKKQSLFVKKEKSIVVKSGSLPDE